MRILCVLTKYNFGVQEKGLSHEYIEFYDTFVRMGYEVVLFDFIEKFNHHGKERMNQLLIEEVNRLRPSLIFIYLVKDEILLDTLLALKDVPATLTVGYFGDDEWRFDRWSSKYSPGFDWVVTTDPEAVEKHGRLGVRAVFKKTGVNHHVFGRKGLDKSIDVSFVGAARLDRIKLIKRLKQDGIDVSAMGLGWQLSLWDRIKGKLQQKIGRDSRQIDKKCGATWLTFEEMAVVFERSKINLNFAESFRGTHKQIKGRIFDVTACGGFLLSQYCPEIESLFIPGKEIACYESPEELVSKIKYYLVHEAEREDIAQAGYNRVMAEHTAEMRLRQIFAEVGLADN